MAKRRRILIVSVNWLGDLLFMTPAIRAIRRANPDAFIACLGPARGLDLLKGNPHLNEVIPLPEGRGIRHLAGWLPLIWHLRREPFDAAFLFHRSFTRAAAAWAAGIPERIGYRTAKRGWLLTGGPAIPPKDSLHKIDWFLRVAEAAGIRPDGRHYDAGLLPEDERAAEGLALALGLRPGEKVVALHAGANWLLKRWPARNFAELADGLAERHRAKLLFIGGAEDLPLIESIRQRMRSRPLVAAGRTTFRQMGALLKRTSLLISNDSGPLHMGMAVGIPVVALFGPTDPKRTGPVTPPPDSIQISSEIGSALKGPAAFCGESGGGVNGAKAAVLFGSIGCPVPCYRLDCPANLCMERITVEQVLTAAERFLHA